MKKVIAILMSLVLLMLVAVPCFAAQEESSVTILYTNDVHCGIDKYPLIAAYRAGLIAKGEEVITVDAGDAIQGEVIGTLTEGEAAVDLMNEVGYDLAILGNHEFDYGMDVILTLAEEKAEYEYISCNFVDLRTDETVFEPYSIIEADGMKIAFIGVSTPETLTSSTPAYFKDENGEYIYGFCGDEFYDVIQNSIDEALTEGADYVVGLGHLGINGTTEGWKSTDVIANTEGLDVFIDAHTHETIEGSLYYDKNGDEVLLSSTGTKLNNIGELTISSDGVIGSKLVDTDTILPENLSAGELDAYNSIKEKVDAYNDEISYLYEELGTTEVKMTAYDETGNWLVRRSETNLADFVADAYRSVTGADIGIVNGGGVRAELDEGVVTRKALMDINPWNNEMCVVEITGLQLLYALEHGARDYPELSGGFMQVSGISFEIDAYKESPVLVDGDGSFIGVEQGKETRVTNVRVGGEPLSLEKTYTVAGSQYVLMQGGDGRTMFEGSKVVASENLPVDSEMLIIYFTETLGGKITKQQYGNTYGDGRIIINDTAPEAEPEETVTMSFFELLIALILKLFSLFSFVC